MPMKRLLHLKRSGTRTRRNLSRLFLVEITGVAGAGKSTLTDLLTQGTGYTRAEFIQTRNPAHLLYVARSLRRLAPILVSNLIRKPRLSWADFKLMVYVTEWHRFLTRHRAHSGGVLLLDQGPIYALVRLRAQQRGIATSRSFLQWSEEMTAVWAATLSAVIWLDAPDDVLRSRIDERAKSHALKGEPMEESYLFIARYRTLFEAAHRNLELLGGPKLLRFATGNTPPQSVADRIRSILAVQMEEES